MADGAWKFHGLGDVVYHRHEVACAQVLRDTQLSLSEQEFSAA